MEGCLVLVAIIIVAIIFANIGEWFRTKMRGPVNAAPRPSPSPARLRSVPVQTPSEHSIHGCSYEVQRDVIYTRVVVDLRGRSPGMLKIAPPGPARSIARMFGDQDIVVGDRNFDARFIVMAKPESLTHRVFSPERRWRLVGAMDRIGRHWNPFVDLSAEQLIVGVVGGPPESRPIHDLIGAAREFIEAILEIRAGAEIVWLENPPGEVGLCQVCGTDMREGVVLCATCKTPHHEECWKYTGECSTYACQETSYIKDGRTVRIPKQRQTPEQWLHEEIDRDRRQTGGGLRAPIRGFPEAEESLRRFEQRQRERRR